LAYSLVTRGHFITIKIFPGGAAEEGGEQGHGGNSCPPSGAAHE